MKALRTAQAGTLESNDIMITVAPRPEGSGPDIEISSIVMAQYGETIQSVIRATLSEQGVTDVHIKAVDRGALDCTIQARVLTALTRAGVILKEECV